MRPLTILLSWFVILLLFNLRRLLLLTLFVIQLSSVCCYLSSFGPKLKLSLTIWTIAKVFKLNKITSMKNKMKQKKKLPLNHIWPMKLKRDLAFYKTKRLEEIHSTKNNKIKLWKNSKKKSITISIDKIVNMILVIIMVWARLKEVMVQMKVNLTMLLHSNKVKKIIKMDFKQDNLNLCINLNQVNKKMNLKDKRKKKKKKLKKKKNKRKMKINYIMPN